MIKKLISFMLLTSVAAAEVPRSYVEIKSSYFKDEIVYYVDEKPYTLVPLKEEKLVHAFAQNHEAYDLMLKHQSYSNKSYFVNLVGTTIILGSLLALDDDEQTIGLTVGGIVALFGGYYQRKSSAYLNEAINRYNGVGLSNKSSSNQSKSIRWLTYNWSF